MTSTSVGSTTFELSRRYVYQLFSDSTTTASPGLSWSRLWKAVAGAVAGESEIADLSRHRRVRETANTPAPTAADAREPDTATRRPWFCLTFQSLEGLTSKWGRARGDTPTRRRSDDRPHPPHGAGWPRCAARRAPAATSKRRSSLLMWRTARKGRSPGRHNGVHSWRSTGAFRTTRLEVTWSGRPTRPSYDGYSPPGQSAKPRCMPGLCAPSKPVSWLQLATCWPKARPDSAPSCCAEAPAGAAATRTATRARDACRPSRPCDAGGMRCLPSHDNAPCPVLHGVKAHATTVGAAAEEGIRRNHGAELGECTGSAVEAAARFMSSRSPARRCHPARLRSRCGRRSCVRRADAA